jgi:hypothetical protein
MGSLAEDSTDTLLDGSTRRAFVKQGALALGAVPVLTAMGPFVHITDQQAPDIIVRGGTVFDGLGGAGARGRCRRAGRAHHVRWGRSSRRADARRTRRPRIGR